MVDFQNSVKDIIQSKADKNKAKPLSLLWSDIYKWSEEGADTKIKDELKARINLISSDFDEIHKKVKENMKGNG